MATNNSINSPLPTTVPKGGTGDTSFTAYSVLCGGTTSTALLQNVSGVGTSGQILTSNGASALPTWQPAGAASVSITAASANIVVSPSPITGTGTVNLGNSPSVSGSVTVGTSIKIPDTTSSTTGIIFHNSNAFIHTGIADTNLNNFLGVSSGNFTLSGTHNNAYGGSTLHALTTGSRNQAFGTNALKATTTGTDNVAVGDGSLSAVITGIQNLCLGSNTGSSYTSSESNNILIGFNVTGTVGESNVLRIGTGTGTGAGNLNSAIISGITGKTSASGVAVLINSSNVLGTTTSSRRFKHNIEDMGDSSDRLMKLRPVTFLYNKEIEDATDEMKFGLIAEEVLEIFPELAYLNAKGEPESVRYNDMPAILLNELQKLSTRIRKYEAEGAV